MRVVGIKYVWLVEFPTGRASLSPDLTSRHVGACAFVPANVPVTCVTPSGPTARLTSDNTGDEW